MTRPLTVLAVDACPAMRRFLSCQIDTAGHDVLVAEGVRPALRLLREVKPDVVLTASAMPGLDGSVLVRLLRRDPRFMDLPIFVVSDETDPDRRALMAATDATGWIAKPLRSANLAGALAAVEASRDQRRNAFTASRANTATLQAPAHT